MDVSYSVIHESCAKAAVAFTKKFNKMAPPRTTISSWKKRMLEIGSQHDEPRSGRGMTDKMRKLFLSFNVSNMTKNVRVMADEADCSRSTCGASNKFSATRTFESLCNDN